MNADFSRSFEPLIFDNFSTGHRSFVRNTPCVEGDLRNPGDLVKVFARFPIEGVIHFAVAFYHVQRHNLPGAERQLSKGLKKLAGYLPEFEGLNTERLYLSGIECLVCSAQPVL